MITNLLISHESMLKHTLIRQPNMRLFDLMALVRNIFSQLSAQNITSLVNNSKTMETIERERAPAGHMANDSSGTGILSILDYSDNRIQEIMHDARQQFQQNYFTRGYAQGNREGHVESSSAKCRCEAETQSVHSGNLGSLSLEAGDAGRHSYSLSSSHTENLCQAHRKGRCW